MSLKIRFVSDYVCPYCLAAKVPLMDAVEGKDVEIEWLPYELTEEPAERVDTYHDPVRKEKWAKTLVPVCEELGIDMKFPPKVIPRPYTRLAFEGYHFAKEQGKGDIYNNLMYTAYFTDEKDIGDMEVLVQIAGLAGLDPRDFRKALEEGVYTLVQKEAVRYAKNDLDVHSVPTIFVGNTRINGAVYTKQEFEGIINAALEMQDAQNIHGMSCGEDGCHFR